MLYFRNPGNFIFTGCSFVRFFVFLCFFCLLHSNLNHFGAVKGWDLDLISSAEMEKHPGNIGCPLQFLCFWLQLYLANTQTVFIYAGTSANSQSWPKYKEIADELAAPQLSRAQAKGTSRPGLIFSFVDTLLCRFILFGCQRWEESLMCLWNITHCA